MKKQYTVSKLLDDALDTSWEDYQMILYAFDGVKASSASEKIWCDVVGKYIAEYNANVDNWGMISADLSTSGRKAMIQKGLLAILRSSICTTKTGVEYYQFGNWPTHDADLKDKPERKGACLNAYYDSVK